jgi:redox-sensitive bicupin YhaK (pirin superfamily)
MKFQEDKAMIDIRPLATLGHADHGWLKAKHHFAFARYVDPARSGWGDLKVWNDDEIAPGAGFAPHPHADMEIVTFVRAGAVTHEDSLGNRGRTSAGDVQVMSAGTGVRHAEYNLESEPTKLFQIWIRPERSGGEPAWGTKPFPKDDRAGRWVVLASGLAEDAEALPIRARARVLGAVLKAGENLAYALEPGRHGYLVPATGAVTINGIFVNARDGAALQNEAALRIAARTDAEIVLVDAA